MPTLEFAASLGRLAANHLWQSTGFAAVAVLLALALRANYARARYWLWLAASVKFLIPFSVLAVVGSSLGRWLVPATPVSRLPFVIEQMVQPFTPLQDAALPMAASAPAPFALLPTLLMSFWFCGLVAVLLYGWTHWRRVAAAVRASTPLKEGRELEALRRIEWRGPPGLRSSSIRLVSSAAKLEPGIFGIFRPILWLPAGIADRLADAELESILAHELCHARRRDNLTAAIHMAVEAIFWFHPLVWWLGARLTEERERACDEEVVQMGGEPQVYAESILKVCEFYLASPVACAAGITGGELKKRIEGIMTGARVCRLGFAKKLLLASIGVAAVGGPILIGTLDAPVGRAQSQDTPAFDAAVVRPVPTAARIGGYRIGPASLTAEAVPLHFLITQAYGVSDYELKGISGWMDLELYAISAKAPGPADHAQMMAMLRNLLAERFKLKVHQETRPAPVYALVLGRGGSKLQPVREGEPAARAAMTVDRVTLPIGQTITDLIHWLNNRSGSQVIGRIVVDRTGLQGKYNIRLAFDNIVDPDGKSGRLDGDIPSSLTQQLGLKLQRAQADVTFLVIDKAERVPTEN